MDAPSPPKLTLAELEAFLLDAFAFHDGPRVEFADGQRALVRLAFHPSQIRPGGTLSGPTMMMLADFAMYALLLSAIGLVPLAVTTNLSIQFLRKPPPADLVAEARMLKLGRSLAVGDVLLRSHGAEAPCAHAVVTYAIPPGARAAGA